MPSNRASTSCATCLPHKHNGKEHVHQTSKHRYVNEDLIDCGGYNGPSADTRKRFD